MKELERLQTRTTKVVLKIKELIENVREEQAIVTEMENQKQWLKPSLEALGPFMHQP